MPGGRCAKNGPDRVTRLTISVAGTTHEILMGGVADASFPNRTNEQLQNLESGDSFGVRWEDAIFTGKHSVLGEITANLIPEGDDNGPSMVRSLQPFTSETSTEELDFFPALNRNHLRFKLHIPRLGLVLGSDEPIVNETEIMQIPPYDVTYNLVEPVSFKPLQESKFYPLAKAAPEVVIQACDVKLVIGHGIDPSIKILSDEGDTITAEFTVKRTTEKPIKQYTWTLWPRPEEEGFQWHGVRDLNGDEDKFSVNLKRDAFFRERWLRVLAIDPYETEVSGAAHFPSLE